MIDLTHLHPMVVHFPIALLLVGFLTDLADLVIKREFLSQTAFYLLILGALGTVAALLSGDQAGNGIMEQGLLGQAVEQHEEAAELTVWLVGIAAAVRVILVLLKRYSGIFKVMAFLLFFASVIAVGRTGYYGGALVYKHAAGVQFNLGTGLIDSPGQENDD